MSLMKWVLLSIFATLLVACGGTDNAGTPLFGGGGGTGGSGTGSSALSLVLSISSTTATSAAPATVTAKLQSSTGVQVSGQVITFSTPGGLGAFSANSALTDANGQAVVQLTPKSPTSNGADLVVANASVNSAAVSGTIGFQVTPSSSTIPTGAPSITLSLSTTAVTATTPATLTGIVRDSAGAPIGGQVVNFSTAGTGLGAFSPSSALSDSTGTVTAQLTPANASSNGADTAIAQATVNGVLATGSIGFTVTSSGSCANCGSAPSISLSLSTATVTTATPATVTAMVRDATGVGVAGQVVKFSTVDHLGTLAVTSALTDATGSASTTLTATSATQSGADQVVATTTVNGTPLQAAQGFQLTASSVTIASVTPGKASLIAYEQTSIQVTLAGTIPGTPVSVSITSACIVSGKATLTPASATTTNGVATFTYHDGGCGATSTTDTLNASIAGSAATGSLVMTIAQPTANSITFVSATPTAIFLKGSGYTETSTIIFNVLDTAGNGLPQQSVLLHATTLAGGLTLDGAQSDETKVSDSNGQVSVLINSGTVPTPVRISATLVAQPNVTTVSSSLSIAVGLPSQLNFSLSQGTRNIEGFNIDGTKNTYNIIASDRLGNPVPSGTSVNFIAEGGQVVQNALTSIDSSGNARATANFLSSDPRPADGRITVVAYSLGEESFIDLNGDNVWSAGEPFQDLGNLYLDRYFNGVYNPNDDQFISTSLTGGAACATIPPTYQTLLGLDVSIPSIANTCDGAWGKAYVRRAIQTVLSTSDANPHWGFTKPSGLAANPANPVPSCPAKDVLIDNGYDANEVGLTDPYYPLVGTALTDPSKSYSFIVSDANPLRLNPMAAGTTISVGSSSTVGAVLLGGTPVPSVSEPSFATFTYGFINGATAGTVTLTFTSPSGLATSVTVPVFASPSGQILCP